MKDLFMDKKKRNIIIATIFSLILTITGTTYAYFSWQSNNNPLVDITVEDMADIIFKGGYDMKKIGFKTIFIFLLTMFLFYYLLKDNFIESMKLLKNANYLYIILAFIIFGLYIIVEAYLLYTLIKKQKKNYKFKDAINLNIMTKFFNGITPFSLGGQPLQIYRLNREGVSVTKGILILVENFIILQITMTLMSILYLIIGYIFNIMPNGFILYITILGIIITIVSLFIAMFLCLKTSVAKKVGYFFINKFKFFKDKEDEKKKWSTKCTEYSLGYKELAKDKKFIIKCVIINFIYMTIYFMVPFFVFKALHSDMNINFIYSIIFSCFIYTSSCFVPIPGASVGAEYSFIHYFEVIVKEAFIIPGLLVWRFITYYIPMIIGGIMFNIIDSKNVKNK